MEHWYLHPAICVYSRKPGVLHSAPLARVPSMHLVNGSRPPRIRAFIRLQGAESRCTQRCLPIGSRPQVWLRIVRPILRVLANPISPPLFSSPFPATVAPAPRRHRLRRDGLSSVDISREYNRCGTEKSPRGIPAIQHR